jgi:hypothetical protein
MCAGLKVSDVINSMKNILHDLFGTPHPYPPSALVAQTHTFGVTEWNGWVAAVHSEPTVFMPLENTFELYGVDFLMDADQRVYLLEVNAGPDFAQTGSRLSSFVKGVISETVSLAIDPFVNTVKAEVEKAHGSTPTAAAPAASAAVSAAASASSTDQKAAPASAAPASAAAPNAAAAAGKFLLCYDQRSLAKGVKANMTFK